MFVDDIFFYNNDLNALHKDIRLFSDAISQAGFSIKYWKYIGSAKLENAILDHLAQVKMLSSSECQAEIDLLVSGGDSTEPLCQLSHRSVIKDLTQEECQSPLTQHSDHTPNTTNKGTGETLHLLDENSINTEAEVATFLGLKLFLDSDEYSSVTKINLSGKLEIYLSLSNQFVTAITKNSKFTTA